jgi:hypothetical protein
VHLAKHVHEGKLILAILDDDLVGTVHEAPPLMLDLSAVFYRGSTCKEQDIIALLPKAAAIHAAGKKAIRFLESQGYPVTQGVRTVGKIPFVHVLQE